MAVSDQGPRGISDQISFQVSDADLRTAHQDHSETKENRYYCSMRFKTKPKPSSVIDDITKSVFFDITKNHHRVPRWNFN